MKHAAIIMLTLLTGCGSQQAVDDAQMLIQARELVALTQQQVEIRIVQMPLLEHDAGTSKEQLEVAKLELGAAQAELKRLREWEAEFEAALVANNSAELERLRRSFTPMVKRLRST